MRTSNPILYDICDDRSGTDLAKTSSLPFPHSLFFGCLLFSSQFAPIRVDSRLSRVLSAGLSANLRRFQFSASAVSAFLRFSVPCHLSPVPSASQEVPCVPHT
jgi:hypothetical protein